MDMVLWLIEYFIDLLSDLRRECQRSAMICGAGAVFKKQDAHTLWTHELQAQPSTRTESGVGQLWAGALVTCVIHFFFSEMLIIKSV